MPQILSAWQPAPLLPFTGPVLNAGVEAVRVDVPPPYGPSQLPQIVAAWIPGPPLPWSGYKLNAAFEAVRVDNPPLGFRLSTQILRAWQPPAPDVIPPAPKLIVSVDLPPPYSTNKILEQIANTWVAKALYRYPLPSLIVSIDNPPPQIQAWLPTVMAAWQIAPQPVLLRAYVPAIEVDNPPPYVNLALLSILDAWKRPPQFAFIRQPGGVYPVSQVDNPPFGMPGPEFWNIALQYYIPPPMPWMGYQQFTLGAGPPPILASDPRYKVTLGLRDWTTTLELRDWTVTLLERNWKVSK